MNDEVRHCQWSVVSCFRATNNGPLTTNKLFIPRSSFIEPFQGAATGVGGILRDVFTMGARPVASMNSLRFGSLVHPEHGRRNRALLAGVVAGIAHYGNAFGVATVGGEVAFDDAYALNPLVNAFALGLVRHDQIFFGKATGAGNPVLYVGAKTGRDGIHGATDRKSV